MHSQPVIAYIAFGSNQADPRYQLKTALSALSQTQGIELIRVSSPYQTAPYGFDKQPNFLNAVIEIKTHLSAWALLDVLLTLEARQGRVRSVIRNGPRPLDLDILLYGQHVINEPPKLMVPHPRMTERDFVLVPLLELAPELKLPNGKPLADYLLNCPIKVVL